MKRVRFAVAEEKELVQKKKLGEAGASLRHLGVIQGWKVEKSEEKCNERCEDGCEMHEDKYTTLWGSTQCFQFQSAHGGDRECDCAWSKLVLCEKAITRHVPDYEYNFMSWLSPSSVFLVLNNYIELAHWYGINSWDGLEEYLDFEFPKN